MSEMRSYNGFSPAERRRAMRWEQRRDRDGTHPHPKPSACDACGQTEGALQRHTEDYSEPFGPHIGRFALCFLCHMMLHVRHRPECAEGWDVYRAAVRAGLRGPALTTAQFGRVWAYATLSQAMPLRMGLPFAIRRVDCVLDEIHRGDHAPSGSHAVL